VVFLSPSASTTGPSTAIRTSPRALERAPARRGSDGHYRVPIGRAELVREGKDVSVLTYGTMVHVAEAAVRLAGVRRGDRRRAHHGAAGRGHAVHLGLQDGRCVVVHEATRFSGYGAELVATVQEQCF